MSIAITAKQVQICHITEFPRITEIRILSI